MQHYVLHLSCSIQLYNHAYTEADNTALYTIKKIDTKHAKSSCAPPNRYKAMLCTNKVYADTKLHP